MSTATDFDQGTRTEAWELTLYASNERPWHDQAESLCGGIAHRRSRNRHRHEDELARWRNLATGAAELYHAEHGDPHTPYYRAWSPATLDLAARMMADEYESLIREKGATLRGGNPFPQGYEQRYYECERDRTMREELRHPDPADPPSVAEWSEHGCWCQQHADR